MSSPSVVTSAPPELRAPAFRSAPEYDDTIGPQVASLCEQIGYVPDPEQRLALDLIFAERGGKPAAFESAVICSRQNMKTGVFKMAAIGWLFLTDQRLVVWSAHEFRTAQEAFGDLQALIGSSDFLSKRVARIRTGAGTEAIELKSGARLIFKARTNGGGRGLTGSKVILDEAFALRPYHMGALLPTLSAVPAPQVLYGSSAGHATSDVLRRIRDRGRTGGDPSLNYLEWCDPDQDGCALHDCDHELDREGCALDDEGRWLRANPIMGRTRRDGSGISVDYIRNERRALPPLEFARERLGWWDEPGGDPVINLATWGEEMDESSEIIGRTVFGLDMPVDRATAALGVAGINAAGKKHLELVQENRGTEWVIPWFQARAERRESVVVIDGGGQAASLIPDLEAIGVEVLRLNGREVAAACGSVYDDIHQYRINHIGQYALDQAVAAVQKRPVTDAFRWGRRDSTVNISPLYAVTLAARGLTIDAGPLDDVGAWTF